QDRVVGALRRRAEPQVPRQPRLHLLFRQVARLARAADAHGDGPDLPQPPAAHDLGRLAERAEDVGPLLAAGLEDAAVLAGRVDAGPGLGQRQRERLLAVHVLARLAGQNRRDRVAVLRRGDADGVDVLAAEEFAKVGVGIATLE